MQEIINKTTPSCSKEPAWFDQLDTLLALLPHRQVLPDGLTQQGSMTAYLEAMNHVDLSVELISQLWEKPRFSELTCLGVTPDAFLMVREVLLSCQQRRCLWARTLASDDLSSSASSPINAQASLALLGLGKRPLGRLLFATASLKRADFQWAIITPAEQDYHKAARHLAITPPFFWARRSVFHWQGIDLLLEEVFHPD